MHAKKESHEKKELPFQCGFPRDRYKWNDAATLQLPMIQMDVFCEQLAIMPYGMGNPNDNGCMGKIGHSLCRPSIRLMRIFASLM